MYAARSTNCNTASNGKKSSRPSPFKLVSREFEESSYTRPHIRKLEELAESTKFTKDEIRTLYRGFKQYCPNGYLTEQILRKIYSKMFPFGDCSLFVGVIFHMLDCQQDGLVTFEHLFQCLSDVSQGFDEDRLKWIFNMYDLDKTGLITERNVAYVIHSVYLLAGKVADEEELSTHARNVFKRFGGNEERHHTISLQYFIDFCQHDEELLSSLLAMTSIT